MADIDVSSFKLPNDNNNYYIKDKTARTNQLDTSNLGSIYHLGFYLDEDGGLCQVDSM